MNKFKTIVFCLIVIIFLSFIGCNKSDYCEINNFNESTAVDENNPFDETTGTLYISDEILDEVREPYYNEEFKCYSYQMNEHYFLKRERFEKLLKTAKKFVVSKDNEVFYTQDGILYKKENNEIAFCPPLYEGEVFINASVSSINYYAFAKCVNITRFIVDPNNENYKDEDGILYSKDGSLLYAYPASRKGELVISPNTRIVSANSACYSKGLEKVVIENRDTKLRLYAFTFFDCVNLKEVQYKFSKTQEYMLIKTVGEASAFGPKTKEMYID